MKEPPEARRQRLDRRAHLMQELLVAGDGKALLEGDLPLEQGGQDGGLPEAQGVDVVARGAAEDFMKPPPWLFDFRDGVTLEEVQCGEQSEGKYILGVIVAAQPRSTQV